MLKQFLILKFVALCKTAREQNYIIITRTKLKSTGFVVMGGVSCQEVVGSNPSIFHISYKNCIVCLKRLKINEKEAEDRTFK